MLPETRDILLNLQYIVFVHSILSHLFLVVVNEAVHKPLHHILQSN